MKLIRQLNNLFIMGTLIISPTALLAQTDTEFSRKEAEKTAAALLQSQVCLDVLNKNQLKKYQWFWKNPADKKIIIFGHAVEKTNNCGSMAVLFPNKKLQQQATTALFSALDVLKKPAREIVAGTTAVEAMDRVPFKKAVKIIRGALNAAGGSGQFMAFASNNEFNGAQSGEVAQDELLADKYAQLAAGDESAAADLEAEFSGDDASNNLLGADGQGQDNADNLQQGPAIKPLLSDSTGGGNQTGDDGGDTDISPGNEVIGSNTQPTTDTTNVSDTPGSTIDVGGSGTKTTTAGAGDTVYTDPTGSGGGKLDPFPEGYDTSRQDVINSDIISTQREQVRVGQCNDYNQCIHNVGGVGQVVAPPSPVFPISGFGKCANRFDCRYSQHNWQNKVEQSQQQTQNTARPSTFNEIVDQRKSFICSIYGLSC